jgi:hypothetical protein
VRRLIVRAVLACGAIGCGVFAVVSACTPPDPIVLGTCGNSIVEIEAGEQCDDFPTDGGFLCFGADAGARACHIACGDGGACPSGFGCGVDGVCRNPSSPPKLVFASATQADVRELALADFDGDGRLDVVTRGIGATGVYYFDGNGKPTGVGGPISLPRGRVTSGRLPNGASASLLAFDTSIAQLDGTITLTGTGLEAWLGQSDRTLTPVLFSTIPLRTASDAFVIGTTTTHSHSGDDDLLTYAQSPSDIPDAGAIVALFTGGPVPLLPQYFLANPNIDSGIRGEIPTGRVPPHLECDTVAIGLARTKSVTVLPTCNDGGPVVYGGAFTKPNVTFASAMNEGPVLFADWNGDGLLDLVTGIALTSGDGGPVEGIQVAFGNADGSFQAGAAVTTQNVSTPLYAVGDIDRDGNLDWVDHTGVFLTASKSRFFTTLQTKHARIVDVNRDGFLDAIAISSAGVDLWLGSGGALMNHRLYDLANATTFAIGDLDGDSNVDIIASANQGGSDTLYVLWGAQGGFPSAPVTVGSVHAVQHLSTGRITWLFGDTPDNVASAMVVGLDESGATTIIPIQGHTNRQLTSPFTLSTADDSGAPTSLASLPLNGAIGVEPFDGGLVPSVTMLASDPTFDASALALTTWMAPATNSTQTFESASLVPPANGGFSLLATSATAAQGLGMTTIDLDPGAKNGDELVAVVPAISGGTSGSLAIAQLGGAGWTPLGSPEKFDGFTRMFTASSAALPVRAMRADFDGDGNADLLLVYGTGKTAGSNTPDLVAAEIRFGDGAGHLVDPVILSDVRTAAPINALGDGHLQLVSVGPKAITLYALTKCGSGALHCFDQGTMMLEGDFSKTIDVICGDVTGDGVDDVIAAEPANFQVFVANAAIP